MTSKRACLSREMVERDVAVLVLLIDQHRMALREGAALAVLAGQPHRMAVEQQRAEGQRLGGRPVDALAGLDRLARASSRKRWMVRWTWKPCGTAVILLADVLERLDRDAGVAAARIVVDRARAFDAGPAAVEPVGLVGLVALARLELGVEPGAPVGAASSRPRPR